MRPDPFLYAVHMASNLVIAVGYLTIAVTAGRYVWMANTTRAKWMFVCAVTFFVGCVGTHYAMLDAHRIVTPFWVTWHVLQAAGTWGAILIGRRILVDAYQLWQDWNDPRAES